MGTLGFGALLVDMAATAIDVGSPASQYIDQPGGAAGLLDDGKIEVGSGPRTSYAGAP
jgi:hypothetical protein